MKNTTDITKAEYRWRESFSDIYHRTECEVLDHNAKTAKIKLLGFGKNGARPGTVLRVHLKSLVGFRPYGNAVNDSWKGYTYFD